MRIPCRYDKSGNGDLFAWNNPDDYIRNGYYHGAFPLKTDLNHRGDVVTLLIEIEDGSFIQLRPEAVRISGHKARQGTERTARQVVDKVMTERDLVEGAANTAQKVMSGTIKVEHVPSEEMYKPQPTQTEINMMQRFSSRLGEQVRSGG